MSITDQLGQIMTLPLGQVLAALAIGFIMLAIGVACTISWQPYSGQSRQIKAVAALAALYTVLAFIAFAGPGEF